MNVFNLLSNGSQNIMERGGREGGRERAEILHQKGQSVRDQEFKGRLSNILATFLLGFKLFQEKKYFLKLLIGMLKKSKNFRTYF